MKGAKTGGYIYGKFNQQHVIESVGYIKEMITFEIDQEQEKEDKAIAVVMDVSANSRKTVSSLHILAGEEGLVDKVAGSSTNELMYKITEHGYKRMTIQEGTEDVQKLGKYLHKVITNRILKHMGPEK